MLRLMKKLVVNHDFSINPFSAGDVFRRQNLTSKDGPRIERTYIHVCIIGLGIYRKRKELTNTFMMISNYGLYKHIFAL